MVSNSHNPNFNEPATSDYADAKQESGENSDVRELQLARLNDYLFQSLAKEDPLEANLGSINTGLIRCSLWLNETIETAINSGPADVDRVQVMMQAIETLLRTTRQVDRFAQLEIKTKAARTPDSDEQNAKHPAPEDDSNTQSEEM